MGFDLVPNSYKWLTSRCCNGKYAGVGQGPWWQGQERESLCGSQTGLRNCKEKGWAGRHLKKSVGLSLTLFNCLLTISSLFATLCLWQVGCVLTAILLESDCESSSALPRCRRFQGRKERTSNAIIVDNKSPWILLQGFPFFVLSLCQT